MNGTNQRLKCTFSSSSPVSQQLSVSWNFQPEDLSAHEPVSEIFVLLLRGSPLPQHPGWAVSGDRYTQNPPAHLGLHHL